MLFGDLNKFENGFYFAFRLFVGLFFMQHGAQKLFGWFGGSAQSLMSQMGLAGVIEFFGGLFIAIGLFTRLFALLGGLQMLIAYFMAHASQGILPISNGGELALLYLVSFVLIFAFGGRILSLDNALFKKEIF
jgi:putative oxidoreductase